jgi:CRP-like cAMP-binding protein
MRRFRSKSLSMFDLFESLDPRELRDLEASTPARTADKGQLVYLSGDRSEAVFFLVSGRVKLSRLSTSGKEFILVILEPGSFFEETGVLDERPRETMAEALETSTFLAVQASAFRGLLKRRPELLMIACPAHGATPDAAQEAAHGRGLQERPSTSRRSPSSTQQALRSAGLSRYSSAHQAQSIGPR